MEEQLNPLAVAHLLQHTLRSLCIHDNSQWVYAVFWRILPRNYPPPKWEVQGSAYDRSRGNRRNWILVWEDGFCNFAASTAEMDPGDCAGSSSGYGNCEFQHLGGLQPELFFKMSHEIYNYGEGLIGKVAADHSHKWVYKDPSDEEINFLSTWHGSGDSYPRTWEAQFQSGIKTIALIAVREGVVQLGAVHKLVEDLSYVVSLRKKFSYLESIPGVLLPHPSSSAFSFKADGCSGGATTMTEPYWPSNATTIAPPSMTTPEFYDHHFTMQPPLKITPSMSSLEALLSKLPSVVPTSTPPSSAYCESPPQQFLSSNMPFQLMGTDQKVMIKEDIDDQYGHQRDTGESSSTSMSSSSYHHHYHHHHQHHHLNVNSRRSNRRF